jgi:micrococcal nuclease
LRNLILDKEILIQTIKDKKGKYGRYLGDIWQINEDNSLSNINDLMVSSGFAEYKEY